jgi:hypothetical protein
VASFIVLKKLSFKINPDFSQSKLYIPTVNLNLNLTKLLNCEVQVNWWQTNWVKTEIPTIAKVPLTWVYGFAVKRFFSALTKMKLIGVISSGF